MPFIVLQDLSHKLGATLAEMQASRNVAWPPWLSKTLTSIKEVAVNKTIPQRSHSVPSDPHSNVTSATGMSV